MSEEKNNASDLHKLVQEVRDLVEEGSKDVVRKEQIERMEAEFSSKLKSMEDTVAASLAPSNIIKTDQDEINAKAFAEYLAKGDIALRDFNIVRSNEGDFVTKTTGDQASLGVGAEGGYSLPKIFDDLVDATNRKGSPLRRVARFSHGTGMGFITPIKIAHGDAATRAEMGSTHSSGASQFDTLAPTFWEVNAEEMVTVWASQGDATIDLVQMAIADVLLSLAEQESNQLLLGTNANAKGSSGTVNNGLLTQTVLHTSVDRFTSTIGSMAGIVQGAAGTVTGDDILNLISVLHQRYDGNKNILTSRELLQQLISQKDTQGRYMLSMGDYADKVQPRIWGVDVIVSDNFAAPKVGATAATTDTPLAIIADFNQAYVIADAAPVSFLVDPYTDKRFIKHLGRKRVGSGIVNYNACRALYAA